MKAMTPRERLLTALRGGFYAAWQVVHMEPVMREMVFYGRGCPVR